LGQTADDTVEKKTAKQNEEGTTEKAGVFYQNAVQLYGEARYRESIEAFNRAISLAPESIYLCNRAIVFLEIGEIEKSLNDLRSLSSNAKKVTNAILADNFYVPPEKGWSMTSWGVLSLGIGAGLIGSAITDFLSEDLPQSFVRESEGRSMTTQIEYDELRSDLETRQFIFYGLSIGAVASALGLSLIIADLGTETEPLSLELGVQHQGPFVKFRF